MPIKPQKYNVSQETSTPIFLSICDTHCTYRFCNKEDYLQIRANIVKKMKIFSQKMNLSMTTFFLALDYFDRLCEFDPQKPDYELLSRLIETSVMIKNEFVSC